MGLGDLFKAKENEQLRREILQLRVEMQHLKNASAKAEK